MPSFLTRVELHGANAIDYANLHEKMQIAKFFRFVKGGDGKTYRLPTADYYSVGDLTVEQVRDIARGVILQTGKTGFVLTAEYTRMAWYLNHIQG